MMHIAMHVSSSSVARYQAQLSWLSHRDELTKLPNRRFFINRVDELIKNKTQSLGYIMTLDLDYFKRVNDTYGHSVGDKCLVSVAQSIHQSLPNDAVFARLGGEEFSVYLPINKAKDSSSDQAALALASQICRQVSEQYITINETTAIACSLSIGVSKRCQDLSSAMKQSDIALYQAKTQGRNMAVMFSDQESNEQVDIGGGDSNYAPIS
ncbi:GGDEF domain-containing protein [Alginatibacterium sediminis]|nr:GGDEF domain-containing protein [Alginatibacterium sediminis]